jgi:general secretion pathway protein G
MTLRKTVWLNRRTTRRSGFTLIEILLVIVILLLLAGALVVFLVPQQKGAEKNTTKLLLSQIGNALDLYRLNIGHYPKEDEGGLEALLKKPTFENERLGEKWQGPYLKPGTTLEDPWGNKLMYEIVDAGTDTDTGAGAGDTKPALPFKLYSMGPDGQQDTDDDIKYMPDTDTGTTPSSGSGTP